MNCTISMHPRKKLLVSYQPLTTGICIKLLSPLDAEDDYFCGSELHLYLPSREVLFKLLRAMEMVACTRKHEEPEIVVSL